LLPAFRGHLEGELLIVDGWEVARVGCRFLAKRSSEHRPPVLSCALVEYRASLCNCHSWCERTRAFAYQRSNLLSRFSTNRK
jgi:hypothetical protein